MIVKTIMVEFDYGEVVFLKTDADQYQRIVIGYDVGADNNVLYKLVCGEEGTTRHYECEITRSKIIT